MSAEAFGKNGLFFDELNKIRILDPAVSQETNELKEECKEFVDSNVNEMLLIYSRLRIQYESLKKEEADQNELIEQFLLQN
ncbi:intraflagellar transport protein 20 homolog [Limulus polyphemus]|uniref:Intraflagellar transport protein 20 homolog n=1 Tax=Limulus polyphemus TaxID=6850 RepID=A0ABM1SVE1_LIMPO|nr:intraflagellar transport protein 20 homolog [Limulus polyphemus]